MEDRKLRDVAIGTKRSSTADGALRQFYRALLAAYGPQGWWPGEGPTEIVIGAILTQNTNWRNVERAIARLRDAGLIDWRALRDVPLRRLSALIRPAGYHRLKARRLKNFVGWLWERYDGSLDRLESVPTGALRAELLSINGIGPETADSILLYALGRPTFVVDAYTRRIVRRHGLLDAGASYDGLKALFERSLKPEARMFNEYHALVVAVGKRHCRARARCEGCPLERFEHDAARE